MWLNKSEVTFSSVQKQKNKARIISIGTVKKSWGMRFDFEDIEQACRALLGLHVYTGCDIVSAFFWKRQDETSKIDAKGKLVPQSVQFI